MKLTAVQARRLFTVGMFLTGALPWLAAAARSRPPPLILLYARLCHQLPERTLVLGDTPMLCCSRCAGIHAGIALGALLPLPGRWLPAMRTVLMLAGLAMLLEVITQDLGWHPVYHPTRLATGLAVGGTLAAWIAGALRAETRRPPSEAGTG